MRKRIAVLITIVAVSLFLLYVGRGYYPPLNQFLTDYIDNPLNSFKEQAIGFLQSELGGTLSISSIFALISGKLGSLWKSWKYKPVIQEQEVRHHNEIDELKKDRDYWKKMADNDVPHLLEYIKEDQKIILNLGREIEESQQRCLEEKEVLSREKEGLKDRLDKAEEKIETLENKVDNYKNLMKEKRR